MSRSHVGPAAGVPRRNLVDEVALKDGAPRVPAGVDHDVRRFRDRLEAAVGDSVAVVRLDDDVGTAGRDARVAMAECGETSVDAGTGVAEATEAVSRSSAAQVRVDKDLHEDLLGHAPTGPVSDGGLDPVRVVRVAQRRDVAGRRLDLDAVGRQDRDGSGLVEGVADSDRALPGARDLHGDDDADQKENQGCGEHLGLGHLSFLRVASSQKPDAVVCRVVVAVQPLTIILLLWSCVNSCGVPKNG